MIIAGYARFIIAASCLFRTCVRCARRCHGSPTKDTGDTLKAPNIVLFVSDQLRADGLGCDGNRELRTPNYDALAAKGIRFRNAFTPCPICVPARACMITGDYPHKITGTKENRGQIPREQITLPQLLVEHGYATYSAGKLHYLPYQPPGHPRTLHGFQQARLAESGRILAKFDPSGNTPGLEDYFDYLGETDWGGYTRAHGIGNNDVHPAVSPLPPELTVDAWVASRAIEFIDQHRREPAENPFFLHVSFPKPHSPFDPPRPYDALYDPRKLTPPRRQRDNLPRTPLLEIHRRRHGWDLLSPEAQQVIKSHYYGLITFQDEQAGRVIEHLKQVGLYEDTIFLFVGDHGEMLGDFGVYFKSLMYEGSVRIPFIISGARVQSKGRILDHLVGLQDLMPTVCALAGVPLRHPVDGLSLAPAVEGHDLSCRTEFIAYCQDSPQQTFMVRTLRSKYIYSELDGIEEFYDLSRDPCEENNCIQEAKKQAEIQHLRDTLVHWAQEHGDTQLLDQGLLRKAPFQPETLKFSAGAMGWRHY